MAFSFTLPELQAELRALGHDGLPDHVILSFLSQLNLPLPSPSALSHSSSTSLGSSGYDSEASFCSTHSLSCGLGSPKQVNTRTGDGAPLSFVEFVDGHPRKRNICQEFTSLLKSKEKLEPVELCDGSSANSNSNRDTGFMQAGAPSNGQHAVRHFKKENPSRSLDSRTSASGHTPPHKAGSHKADAGCEARSIHSVVLEERGNQASPDKIIEHYWISVGEEHMRAMHSKSTKEEQLKRPSSLELPNATSASETREGKVGYRSLIEKVEQCEDELQRLTLRLQAQQCKKPWFLEAARKPRVSVREKCNIGGSDKLMEASGPTSPVEPICTLVEQGAGGRELSAIAVSITCTCVEDNGQEFKSSSLDCVQECEESPCENLAVSEEGYEKLLDKGMNETDTLETESASIPESNELEEFSRHQDQKDTTSYGLGPDQRDEHDHSVCSRSSSASYQHSRSSGDSRSNVSQHISARSSSSRRSPCSTLQQQRRRGGKIDRVARFAAMQQVWKKDAFLVANEAGGKRKGIPSFHHHFSTLHSTSSY